MNGLTPGAMLRRFLHDTCVSGPQVLTVLMECGAIARLVVSLSAGAAMMDQVMGRRV
jgi:hypothetical protein